MRDAKSFSWLPSDYRANPFSVRDTGSILSLGHASGKVTLFEFDILEMNR